jgi:hypothetical protein
MLTQSRPDVEFFCDIEFDPFLFMEDNNKTYGFTISLYEYQRTIETLWPTVKGIFVSFPVSMHCSSATQSSCVTTLSTSRRITL